jgi:glycosyltransferase involved in cell wall biosynthesis
MYSVVIPVYKNEGSIPLLVEALGWLSNQLSNPLEVVFVVDGSPDASLALLREHLGDNPFVSRVIALSRNFGAFQAIRVGLEHATGRFIGVMAADLQEPVSLMQEFFRVLESEDYDLAFGKREGRDDPLLSRLSSDCFWFFYRKLIVQDVPPGGVDVFAVTARVRDVLVGFKEHRTSLLALLFWIGFKRTFVPYRRQTRQHGRSGWTFRKKWNYMLDSIYSFSDLPIRLLGVVGLVGISISAVMALIALTGKVFGAIPVPGYATTVIVVSFFGGLNSLGISTLGAYVWRSFENTKGRPNSIIMEIIDFSGTRE